ncbi:Uncharacterised protein [Mycobacteroides abscessus]|nr:Uncharacterised protein [Mycobacteroides abscessus]
MKIPRPGRGFSHLNRPVGQTRGRVAASAASPPRWNALSSIGFGCTSSRHPARATRSRPTTTRLNGPRTCSRRSLYAYLSVRIDNLCRQDERRTSSPNGKGLHSKVRSQLGLTRPRIALPTPCPDCDMRPLMRYIDVQRDWIECGNCPDADPQRALSAVDADGAGGCG